MKPTETEDASTKPGSASIAQRVLVVTSVGGAVAMVTALLEPSNRLGVTLVFYGLLGVALVVAAQLFRRGRVRLVGWLLASLFFAMSVVGTLVVGSVVSATHTAYVLAVMVAASILGRRPALLFLGLSIAALTVIAVAETQGWLPAPMTSPSSVQNAWISVTIPLAFATYLIVVSLREREKVIEESRQRARERDEAHQRLVEAQKLEVVGRMAAGIAHDFNNLLTVIQGSTELMRLTGELDPQLLDGVEDATRRATLLTSRILTLGRPRELRPERIDPALVLHELHPLLQRLVGDELRVEVDASPSGTIEIDPVAFEQVVVNLVINAKQAIDGSGTVRIDLARDRDALVVTVSDSGPGIPASERETVFEPFHTTKTTGTGLGLATVRSLVEGAGGTVAVGEAGIGGAKLICRFARHDPGAEMESVDVASLQGPRGLTVLLVEDDDLVREATTRALRARGWRVEAASDGVEALSRLERARPDAIITDNMMHGMSGLELAATVRGADPAMPILIVSGNPIDAALPARVAFLSKPYSHAALVAAVDALIASGEGGDEALARSR